MNTNYYFNVLIKDEAGNIDIYESNTGKTLNDIEAPVVGNNGTISTTM